MVPLVTQAPSVLARHMCLQVVPPPLKAPTMHCPHAVTSALLALTPDRGLPLLKTLQDSPLLPGTVQAPDDLVLALYHPVSTPLPA